MEDIIKKIYEYVYENYDNVINDEMIEILNEKNFISDKIKDEFSNFSFVEKNSMMLAYLIYLHYLSLGVV